VVFLVKVSHCGAGRGDDVVDKEEESVLGSKADAFPDQEVKLSDSQVRWYEVLLFVQVPDSSPGGLLDDDRNTVWVFLSDLFAFCASLFEGMFFLVLPLHFGLDFDLLNV